MRNAEVNLITARRALRIGFGVAAFLAGLDKFFNVLTNWEMYLSPVAAALLPFDPAVLMPLVGMIEMAVGLAILSVWTRLASYIAAAWLVLISINLLLTGIFWDLAVRDLVMALGAFTLARLTEWQDELVFGERDRMAEHSGHQGKKPAVQV